jgi:hypothetical protein
MNPGPPHVGMASCLGQDDIEAIAVRVVELLERQPPGRRALNTEDVAWVLDASTDYVREHAGELAGWRLADGPRGQLRFDAAAVREFIDRRRLPRPPGPRVRRRPGPSRRPDGVELLPVRDVL